MRYWLILLCCSMVGSCGPVAKEHKPEEAEGPREEAADVMPRRLAFSPNGKWLLLACSVRNLPKFRDFVTLWDAEKGKMICRFDAGYKELGFIGFVPSGEQAFADCRDCTVKFYAVSGGKMGKRVHTMEKSCGPVALSPDGKTALTMWCAAEGNIKGLTLWDMAQWKLVRKIPGLRSSWKFLAMSPDKRLALTSSYSMQQDNRVRLWDLLKGKVIYTFPTEEGWGGPLAFTQDSKLALIIKVGFYGDKNRYGQEVQTSRVVLWDPAKKKIVKVLERGMGKAMHFLANGKLVVTTGPNYTVQVWETMTGKVLKSISVYPGDRKDVSQRAAELVSGFDISADGGRAAAVYGKNQFGEKQTRNYSKITVKVWDLTKGRLLRTWHCPLDFPDD